MADGPDAGPAPRAGQLADASAPFVYRRRVEFAETDMAGIAHFSMYFRYMEEAEHALWRAAGLTIAPADADHGFPRVSASCDFHAPLRFEDDFEVRLHIAEAGSRTLRYAAKIVRGETSIATGAIVIACVTKVAGQPMKARAIPDYVRRALGVKESSG
jgi:YbgC/YbaW family acyl-CoA thioester hydrolase